MKPRDVFVSYCHPDHDCAFDITAWVEARNIGVWIAPRDVSPTADWAADVIDAISAARIMVLVFSASTNESVQVRREVERAVHKGLIVLPFRIEDVMPAKSLEYFLSSQHWLDAFPPPREPYYQRLCAFLERALAAAPIRPDATRSATADGGEPGRLALDAMPNSVGVDLRPQPHWANVEQLHQVELELARYIGPVARHLVRRTAASCADLAHLILRLSAEIDADRDRQMFTSACCSKGWIPR